MDTSPADIPRDDVDHIYFSVSCSFFWDETYASIFDLTEPWKFEFDREQQLPIITMGRMLEVAEADPELRQEYFLSASEQQLNFIAEAGVERPFIDRFGAFVRVSISLSPASGQAGIVLTTEWLESWARVGANIFIDAFRD